MTSTIYIPYVNINIMEDTIAEIFYNFGIGQIKRVDFLESDPTKPGTRQIFVHMQTWFNSPLATAIKNSLLDNIAAYRFQFSHTAYWLLLPAKNPIQDTVLNIHQLAENMRLLENRFAEKEAEITALKGLVADLTIQVRYLEDPEWIPNNSPISEEKEENDILNTGFIMDGKYYEAEE